MKDIHRLRLVRFFRVRRQFFATSKRVGIPGRRGNSEDARAELEMGRCDEERVSLLQIQYNRPTLHSLVSYQARNVTQWYLPCSQLVFRFCAIDL